MSSMVIKNGRVVCPSQGIDAIADVYVKDGVIVSIGNVPFAADKVINADSLVVAPGLVDMHVHLRDPGYTEKEDILTGCEAAAAGGVTSLAAMPNTKPVTDTAETIQYILHKAQKAKAKVYPVCSITKNCSGQKINDFKELRQAGAVACSDDGLPVENALVMQNALIKAKETSIPLISHCEDRDIIGDGIINDGEISEFLGVEGMHRSSEDSVTARDIALARANNAPIHIAHVSTRGAVEIIRAAKAAGAMVTCETCPHYFFLTHDELMKKDADYRMNPPLREPSDVKAIIQGLCDGTIDCIATDHAPHTKEEKSVFTKAPNGVVGLETSLAAALTKLYHTGRLSLPDIIRLMSETPAKILGISAGTLKPGSAADIVIFDPNEEWTVEPEKLHSKSKNSAFKGKRLKGKVKYTILNGEIVFGE